MPDFVIRKKKKKEAVQCTFRIEPELLETIKKTVIDYNLQSMNEFINACIQYSIDNMKIIDEDEEE